MVRDIVACARRSAVQPSCLTFIAFDVEVVSCIKKSAPEYHCFGIANIWPTGWRWLDELRALRFARRCHEAGLDGADYNAHTNVVTPRVVDHLHSCGLLCAVWVSRAPARNDSPEIWRAMAAINVDIFTSNCPETIYQWWRSSKTAE
eukprot:TRINITY_DN80555_c0_g1_i1.p1 TRINITY_DN80555_c0_g1~~TRINITY_DN80555_c0_g1_i1.p1  ORF type:complete len:147 (-),score=5.08 TRINITY_DN80555_c0_g1_i1:75-515(-)